MFHFTSKYNSRLDRKGPETLLDYTARRVLPLVSYTTQLYITFTTTCIKIMEFKVLRGYQVFLPMTQFYQYFFADSTLTNLTNIMNSYHYFSSFFITLAFFYYISTRSLKISEQIDMLGQLLCSNGIDVKINKYNILSKVRTALSVARSSVHDVLTCFYTNYFGLIEEEELDGGC
jgi:hypothetical protein